MLAKPAARHSSSPISRRRGACARSRPSRRSMCSTACCPARPQTFADLHAAAGDRQPRRARRMGCLRRRQAMARRRRAARRHRHEPARPYRRTKPPRLRRACAPRTHGITLLMSHFVCSRRQPNHPLNDQQIKLFREIRVLYRGMPASLANSSGIFLGRRRIATWCGPALRLYGVNPTPKRNNPMRPVVELQARIVQVRDRRSGETVGYNATWTAEARRSRIAIVAVGYADGYLPRGQRLRSEIGRRSDRRRPALPDRRTRLDGPARGRRHRPAGRAPSGAATSRP